MEKKEDRDLTVTTKSEFTYATLKRFSRTRQAQGRGGKKSGFGLQALKRFVVSRIVLD